MEYPLDVSGMDVSTLAIEYRQALDAYYAAVEACRAAQQRVEDARCAKDNAEHMLLARASLA